jgi:hypothetical protein
MKTLSEPRVLLLLTAGSVVVAVNFYAIAILLGSNQVGVAPDYEQ